MYLSKGTNLKTFPIEQATRIEPRSLRRGPGAALFTLTLTLTLFTSVTVRAATGEAHVSRVRGSVGFTVDPKKTPQPIAGSTTLANDAFVITQARSLATLTLADTSVVDIGAASVVQIGAFHAVGTGQNVITVDRGTIHFVIRHPASGSANYTFQTPTSQIAVRGTEGVIAVSSGGTTVALARGTVSVTTGSSVVTIGAGQSVTVGGSSVTNAARGSVANIDPASATSATLDAAPAASAAGRSSGAIVGTAALVGALVLVAASSRVSPTSALLTSAPGPILATSSVGSYQNGGIGTSVGALPGLTQTATFAQSNCTGPLSIAAVPASSVSIVPATLPCVNGQISGTVALAFLTYGTIGLGAAGSGQQFTHTEMIYGFTTVTVAGAQTFTEATGGSISYNGVGNLAIDVIQPGPTPSFNVTLDCSATSAPNYHTTDPALAGVGLNALGNYSVSGTGPLAFSLVVRSGPVYGAIGAPAGALPAACSLIVTGAGNDHLVIPVNITSIGIGIAGQRRTTLDLPNGRKPH